MDDENWTSPGPGKLAGMALLGALAGWLCHWVLPAPWLAVVSTCLCLVVGVVNLRPPYLIPDELTSFGLFLGLVQPVAGWTPGLLGGLFCLVIFWLLERTGQMGVATLTFRVPEFIPAVLGEALASHGAAWHASR
ncbi:MAG: hypothetical protein KF760_09985 [Candidatus Eremiobacteraeota bacterium]|nr:hypothetical protein [Candidatus Eremiobacteraeota bacterium]MCW5868913.1 hypothetical protein [Candidatus Eremiobacteraeota bacterium]